MPTSTRDRIAALPLTALLAWSAACGGSNPAQAPTPERAPERATPAKGEEPSEVTPPAEAAIEEPPADAPLPLLGKAAPPITLEGTQGSYDLEKARAEGPVLAIFYRGDW